MAESEGGTQEGRRSHEIVCLLDSTPKCQGKPLRRSESVNKLVSYVRDNHNRRWIEKDSERNKSGCGENTQKTVAMVKERQTMKAWIKIMAMDKFNTH